MADPRGLSAFPLLQARRTQAVSAGFCVGRAKRFFVDGLVVLGVYVCVYSDNGWIVYEKENIQRFFERKAN
jgi:hypothetical protein